ncbi:MAG: branched chain amino acid aminotransferase, partial [Bacteroidota bacterium]
MTTELLDLRVQPVEQSRLPEIDFSNLAFGRTCSDHMFVTDFDGNDWTDPRIVPYKNMALSPA